MAQTNVFCSSFPLLRCILLVNAATHHIPSIVGEDVEPKAPAVMSADQQSIVAEKVQLLQSTQAAEGDSTQFVRCLLMPRESAVDMQPVLQHVSASRENHPTTYIFYMVKMPKFAVIQTQQHEIEMAQQRVEDLTHKRASLNAELRTKMDRQDKLIELLNAMQDREISIREAIKKLRKEMGPHKMALNEIKPETERSVFKLDKYLDKGTKYLCSSEEDLNEIIASLEGKSSNTSIKDLNGSNNSQVCANTSLQAPEVHDTKSSHKLNGIHSRLKPLLVELDLLKKEEKVTAYNMVVMQDECNRLNAMIVKLRYQRNAAHKDREDAYQSLQKLCNAGTSQNNKFYQNRREIQEAKTYALQKQKDAVKAICNAQMEKALDLYINDSRFRADYVKSNDKNLSRGRQHISAHDVVSNISCESSKSTKAGISMEKERLIDHIYDAKRVQSIPIEGNSSTKSARECRFASFPPSSIANGNKTSIALNPHEKKKGKVEEDVVQLREQRHQHLMAKARKLEAGNKKQAETTQGRGVACALKEANSKEKERQKRASEKEISMMMILANGCDDVKDLWANTSTKDKLEGEKQADPGEEVLPPLDNFKVPSRPRKKTPNRKQQRCVTKKTTPSLLSKKSRGHVPSLVFILAFISVVLSLFCYYKTIAFISNLLAFEDAISFNLLSI